MCTRFGDWTVQEQLLDAGHAPCHNKVNMIGDESYSNWSWLVNRLYFWLGKS